MGAYCMTLHVRRRLPAQLFCQYPQIFDPPATEQPGEFVGIDGGLRIDGWLAHVLAQPGEPEEAFQHLHCLEPQ